MPARGSLRPKDNYETPRIKDVEGDAKRRLPATSTSQLPLPAQFPTTTCVGVSSGEATPHSASRPHTAAHFSSHIELYSCCGCPRRIGIQHDQIRELARLERPEILLEPNRLRP